ncbi:MAG: class I SAM-dependent methyltransferase, partial [archaeon]|nr:class I SAM-dependent methyltransferase [archaeon]
MGWTKKWQEDFADVNVHGDLYNSKNPAIKFVHKRRAEIIAETVEKLAPKNLVEVACGDGYVLEEISKARNAPKLTGVEISEKRIARCR